MKMITIRQMRYFTALFEARHFGRAAHRLNISQPALSAQIAQMETFFGGALFERGAHGIVPTAEGVEVAARIERILSDVRELEALAGGAGAVLSRRLRLGLIASVAPYLLPFLLTRLQRDHPELNCELRESVTDRLLADLQTGEIDCAVVALPLEEIGVETISLFDDPFHLAVPEADRRRFPGAVPADGLRGERLILLEEGHCLRDQALRICQIADPAELAALGATSLTTILGMVAGGLGATLIPDMAIADEGRRSGLAILPFAEPVPFRTIALAFRGSTSRRRDFEALAGLLRQALADMRPAG